MATIKKILKPAEDKPAKTASDALTSLLKDKEISANVYNEIVPEGRIISSGSLLLDSAIKVRSGMVLRLVAKQAEAGKAQPLWSNVLTPSGWRKIGDLQVGDKIMNSEGGISEVLGVFPQGKRKINAVHFSDKTVVHCCDEHLWFTRTKYNRADHKEGSVKTTLEIKNSIKKQSHNNHSIPFVKPIDFGNKEELEVDPYLMGLILGDGSFRNRYNIGFTTADAELKNLVEEKLPKGFKLSKNGNSDINFRIHGIEFVRLFNNMGLNGLYSHEKFIPQKYLLSSIENRTELLRGLMDTDGSSSSRKDSCSEFSTTSPRLAEDIVFLARSLGGKVKMVKRQTSFTHKGEKKLGKPSYRILMSFTNLCPFKLERKAKNTTDRTRLLEKYITGVFDAGEEECVCIKTSANDSLYVTDGFNLTHNTSQALAFAENYMKVMEKSKTIFIKAEGRLSPEMMRRTGMNFVHSPAEWNYGTVFVLSCNVFETIARIILDTIKDGYESGEHICVIIDSMDGLILKADLEKGFDGNPKVAGVPLLTKLLFRQLALPVNHYDALLMVTGQYAAEIKLDPYAPNVPRQTTSSGGSSISHQSDYVLEFQPRYGKDLILENEKEKPDLTNNKILGVWANVAIRKSANDVTGMTVSYPVKKGVVGQAHWLSKEIADIMIAYQMLSKGGSWFTFAPEILTEAKEANLELPEKVQGINSVYSLIEENEPIKDYFYTKIKKMIDVS